MRRHRHHQVLRFAQDGTRGRTTARAGFTLWEIATVLLIIAITASLAAPAFVQLGQAQTQTSADAVIKLLHDSRALAVEHGVETTVLLDPKTGHYRVDTASTFGSGTVAEDSLRLGAAELMESDKPRLRYVFRPTGAAFADTMTVRGSDSTRVIVVDPWSGVAHAKTR
ncbi:MAG TPA: prepilin-type N-terminal cleavage/methylation domain-containing protein [Gemmatimonadaceae bacterium]